MSSWIDQFRALNPDTVADDEVSEKKSHKYDLFKVVLPALDRRDKQFYNNADDEGKKELSKLIWVLTRWMSSTKNNTEHHLMLVNDIVNVNSSTLKTHPELQWKLLALCGTGKSQMHQWVAPPKGIKRNKLEETILSFYPSLKVSDLELLLSINTTDEIRELLIENGIDEKEIKSLLS